MDAAVLSAASALAGSLIGAASSVMTTWLTQRGQVRAQARSQQIAKRELLYTEFTSEVADQQGAMERVAQELGDEGEADWADGLTLTSERWWFNLRPSNTEPLLRLNVAARRIKATAALPPLARCRRRG